ncbi:hypothetical protein C8R44DRAFT_868450 [Mycena epipterygia]|nr:hypothetical protein C8R44DRAFT_868450 [Mycena epipterygia]
METLTHPMVTNPSDTDIRERSIFGQLPAVLGGTATATDSAARCNATTARRSIRVYSHWWRTRQVSRVHASARVSAARRPVFHRHRHRARIMAYLDPAFLPAFLPSIGCVAHCWAVLHRLIARRCHRICCVASLSSADLLDCGFLSHRHLIASSSSHPRGLFHLAVIYSHTISSHLIASVRPFIYIY